MLGEEPPAGLGLERGKLQPAVRITVDEEVDDAAAEVAVAVEEDDPLRRNCGGIPLRAGRAPIGSGGRRGHGAFPQMGGGEGRGDNRGRGIPS